MDAKKDSDSNNKNTLQNKAILGVFFKDDAEFEYIYKKTERIISAVYLISNLLDPEEPLKWELRAKSLSLLPDLINVRYASGVLFQERFDTLRAAFLELVSLFEIGLYAGYFSDMNFAVIKREIEHIAESLAERSLKKEAGGTLSLSADFFKVDNGPVPLLAHGTDTSRTTIHKGQENVLYNRPTYKTPTKAKQSSIIKDIDALRDERRSKILEMLRVKSNLTIKDFAGVIKDCSEKTIQRILISMVEDGVLKKEGERRWSTYSLSRIS